MRGFHLYAVLLGSLMVAITVAYSLFLTHQEHSKIDLIIEMERRARFIPVTDIIREESFSAVSVVFRSSFQNFLEHFYIYLPSDYLESGDFEGLANNIFKDKYAVRTLASYIYAELQHYATVAAPGRDIELIGGPVAIEEAIGEGFELILDDRSVILVINTRKLSPEVRDSLPKLRVCDDGYCREITVFPEEKVEVTIPLRLKLALEKAREAYMELKRRKRTITFKAGFCKENCAACGVFTEDGRLVYPPPPDEKKKDYCEGFSMRYYTGEEEGTVYFIDSSGFYLASGIEGGGCKNLILKMNGLGYVECSNPEKILLNYYELKLDDLGLDGDVVLDPQVVRSSPTVLFSSEMVTDLGLATISAQIPVDWLGKLGELLGFDVYVLSGTIRVPGTPCKKVGYGYCAYPAELRFLFSWTDENTYYSVSGSPVTYRFKFSLGKTGIENDIQSMYAELNVLERNIKTEQERRSIADAKCVEELQNLCKPEVLRYYLMPLCGSLYSTTLEGLLREVNSKENTTCRLIANLYVGEKGICNKEASEVCAADSNLPTPERLRSCAVENLRSCWGYLATLAKEGVCKDYFDTGEKIECVFEQLTDLTLVGLIKKVFTGIRAEVSNPFDMDRIVELAASGVDKEDLCYANKLVEMYYSGSLEGNCLEEVNGILSAENSPCKNPLALCVTLGPLGVDTPDADLCKIESPVKLRSTIHYNLFELEGVFGVGCYRGGSSK